MSMNIVLNVDGLQECIDMVKPFADEPEIKRRTEEVMTPTIEEMTARLRERAPYKTGTYRRSIMWEKDEFGWTAGTESPVGVWLEFGTGIRGEFPTDYYIIRPRYKKALRWQEDVSSMAVFFGYRGRVGVQTIRVVPNPWTGGSDRYSFWTSKSSKTKNDVFAKLVRHPGIRSRPHFRPTFEEYGPIIHARLFTMFKKLIPEGGGT
jgi:hypothetical protein